MLIAGSSPAGGVVPGYYCMYYFYLARNGEGENVYDITKVKRNIIVTSDGNRTNAFMNVDFIFLIT